jgi:hypothetical protein
MGSILKFDKVGRFFLGATVPSGPGPLHYQGFTITLRHTTVGRTPLDEGSSRRRTSTYNIPKRQTSMPPARFESSIPARERLPTQALDSVDTGITKVGSSQENSCEFSSVMVKTGRPCNEQISRHNFFLLDTYHSDIHIYCQRLLFLRRTIYDKYYNV